MCNLKKQNKSSPSGYGKGVGGNRERGIRGKDPVT